MVKVRLRTSEVRTLLSRRNLSQNNLAHRLSISSGYCSQLLSGARCPSPRLRKQLMRELKADFDTLFETAAQPEGVYAYQPKK